MKHTCLKDNDKVQCKCKRCIRLDKDGQESDTMVEKPASELDRRRQANYIPPPDHPMRSFDIKKKK